MREILKAKYGLGKNCDNPPQDFLTEVECEKERRLKFLKTARDEMKCGSKYKDCCSQEFKLFDSHYETLARTGKRFSVDERKRKHQASEVSWRQYI